MEETKDLQPLFCYTLFKIVEGSSSMCTTIHYKTRRFLSLTAFNEPSLCFFFFHSLLFFLPAFIRNIVGVVCCLCFAFSVSSSDMWTHVLMVRKMHKNTNIILSSNLLIILNYHYLIYSSIL